MTSIAVQPPPYAQTNTTVYPPLVVRSKFDGNIVAVAILVDQKGEPVEEFPLLGNASANGHQMVDDGSTMFVFPRLIIPRAGGYYLRVDIFDVGADPDGGWVFLQSIYSRGMAVLDGEVQRNRPSTYLTPLP